MREILRFLGQCELTDDAEEKYHEAKSPDKREECLGARCLPADAAHPLVPVFGIRWAGPHRGIALTTSPGETIGPQ